MHASLDKPGNTKRSLETRAHEGGELLSHDELTHGLSIPHELAQNIQVALRVQDKVDDALMAGHRPGFLRTLHMLNCRKSVSAVLSNKTRLKELTSRKDFVEGDLTSDTLEEASGIPELKADIEATLLSGRAPVLGSTEDLHIASHLDDHPEDLPAVVHLFDIPTQSKSEIIARILGKNGGLTTELVMQKLHRNHTFLVLGKNASGKYVCFHKQGPNLHHRFELLDLESLDREGSSDTDVQTLFVSFIAPISLVQQKSDGLRG